MHAFDDIYILDLHGNSKKKETAPDGSKDENVFDIQQGVAIGIFVKRPPRESSDPTVRNASLYGLRNAKYAQLRASTTSSTQWTQVSPATPYHLFVPTSGKHGSEYANSPQIQEAFGENVTGIVTARDAFATDFDTDTLLERMRAFVDPSASTPDVKTLFNLSENYAWRVGDARLSLRKHLVNQPNMTDCAKPILYRPFDTRLVFYHPAVVWRTRDSVMRHMLAGENLGLCSTRSTEIQRGWEHVFCTRTTVQHHSVSLKEVNYLFPLYLYPSPGGSEVQRSHPKMSHSWPPGRDGRVPNLSREFVADFAKRLRFSFISDGKGDLRKTFGPEDIFHYIYAVFHSPTYRKRYAEFLKIDFPRVPITSDVALFRKLCALGAELVGLHLLERVPEPSVTFPVSGNNTVEKVRYEPPTPAAVGARRAVPDSSGRVYINKDQYFDNVPPEVWEFHIGGYQVADKWLKDRKGRALSYDNITHYRKTLTALGETIRLMSEIDAGIPKWPIE